MPTFWSTRKIGAANKNSLASELSFEFDCPKREDYDQIFRIFYKSFMKAYIGHDASEMGLSDVTKSAFLKKTFDDEIQAICDGQIHCVVAKLNEKPVAAATYKINHATGNLYLSVFGVLPGIQSKGIGQQIIAILEKKFNGLNGIDLYTRKFNKSASTFYTKHKFQEIAPKSVSIDVNEDRYTAFRYSFRRKNAPSLRRAHSLPDLTKVSVPKYSR